MAHSLLGNLVGFEKFAWHTFITIVICLVLFGIYRAVRYYVKIHHNKKEPMDCRTKEGGYAKCDCRWAFSLAWVLEMPGCGVNVCVLSSQPCKQRRCFLPVGPTVDSAADMMASAVTARTGSGIFPRIETSVRGVKLTRPGFNDVYKGRNYGAWVNGALCDCAGYRR